MISNQNEDSINDRSDSSKLATSGTFFAQSDTYHSGEGPLGVNKSGGSSRRNFSVLRWRKSLYSN